MSIELIAVKPRDEKRQVAFFKVDKYEFSAGDVPVALDTNAKVSTWLKKNEDFYMFLILQRMYRKGEAWADWKRFKTEENTQLEAMEAWIADGCRNIVGYEDEEGTIPIYEVIEKKSFRSTHPAHLKLEKEIDAVDIGNETKLKKLLKDIITK